MSWGFVRTEKNAKDRRSNGCVRKMKRCRRDASGGWLIEVGSERSGKVRLAGFGDGALSD